MAEDIMFVDSVEALEKAIAAVKLAQEEYAKFTQEQYDEIFKVCAMAANNARISLAKEAVAETGMGIVEDKVIKNHYASEYIYNKYKDIFNYFDAPLVGLTATPKDEIDKNTYEIFELENGVPTYGYELGQAVTDGFLVDFMSVESKLKFQAGIRIEVIIINNFRLFILFESQ